MEDLLCVFFAIFVVQSVWMLVRLSATRTRMQDLFAKMEDLIEKMKENEGM